MREKQSASAGFVDVARWIYPRAVEISDSPHGRKRTVLVLESPSD